MRRRWVSCWVLAMVACAPPRDELRPAPRCALAPLPLGPLRADGGQLLDEAGRVVFLRGVNAGGRSKFTPYLPFELTGEPFEAALSRYLDLAASLGANVLRVPFTWAAVEPSAGARDELYLTRYDALLEGAAARGMFTVVDFHQDIFSEALCGSGFPAWAVPDAGAPHHDCPDWAGRYLSDQAVRAAFVRFWTNAEGLRDRYLELWTVIAAREAGRAGVIGFEPFNEPSAGGMGGDWGPAVLRPFYEEVAARIHAVAPGALIFVDTTGVDALTATTSLTRPSVDQLVLAPHFYDPAVYLGGGVTAANAAPLRRWRDLALEWNVPLFIGEFGAPLGTPGAEAYLSAHFDLFDRFGISGTQWELSTSGELWNDERMSLADERGVLRDELARPLTRPFVSRVAGALRRVSYDGTLRLELDAVPHGVSEVSLSPAHVGDPSRTTVHATGGVCVDVRGSRLLIRADEPGPTVVTVP